MRERPILFSGAMVRAILADTKTQTRRLVTVPEVISRLVEPSAPIVVERVGDAWYARGWPDIAKDGSFGSNMQWCTRCPFPPGDRLWVKESIRRVGEPTGAERWCESAYVADGTATTADCWPWKNKALPSIHCPRGLSRITLEITSVRVERLQDISEKDAREEGVAGPHEGEWICNGDHVTGRPWAHSFLVAWEQINGKRAPWASNPWVWVVSFRRAALGAGSGEEEKNSHG